MSPLAVDGLLGEEAFGSQEVDFQLAGLFGRKRLYRVALTYRKQADCGVRFDYLLQIELVGFGTNLDPQHHMHQSNKYLRLQIGVDSQVRKRAFQEGRSQLGQIHTKKVEVAVLLLEQGHVQLEIVFLEEPVELEQVGLPFLDQAYQPFLDGVDEGSLQEGGGEAVDEKGEVLEVLFGHEASHVEGVDPLLDSLCELGVSEEGVFQRYSLDHRSNNP